MNQKPDACRIVPHGPARRQKPQIGDIFRFCHDPLGWHVGRVVKPDANVHLFDGCVLAYFFAGTARTREATADIPVTIQSLLLPPCFASAIEWRNGVFETFASRPFAAGELLPHHCFSWPVFLQPKHVDQDGRGLPKRLEPCGAYALVGIDSLALAMCEAREAMLAGREYRVHDTFRRPTEDS